MALAGKVLCNARCDFSATSSERRHMLADTSVSSKTRTSATVSGSKMDQLVKTLRKERRHAKAKLSTFLIDHGFKTNAVNSPRKRWCGMSYTYPLHVAVEQNDVEIVSLLLDCGADPEARDSWGRTPRQRAESAGAAVRRSFAAHKTRRKVLFGL
mmetsp:Transcript_136546/g.323410  ORF Transcript_136546/g.323410 Transcript_136546/m.323410 type:complete len:155 (-) Transcript_136546:303-767(-)|eukprot:CAMPEP_0181442798 /NCGR_PEP_ID=MMETSP1110-20121109/24216_1 /TAXON_ID=174948 /ORGANISM="Symbiodinium sp., Strain CCMP421" /LENGTH=154 /DNA_ID=CAMNT_0023566739 /DNA_START=60 /DNA_END=524 /DNA_ORIENTATION=+